VHLHKVKTSILSKSKGIKNYFLKHLKVYLQPSLDLFKTKNRTKKQKMVVFGKEISILSNLGTEDYFSLTDLAKNFDAENQPI
jgi:hypothetical protein